MSDEQIPPPPPPPPPPSSPVESVAPTPRSLAQNVLIVSLLAALVGSFLPWFTASTPFFGTLTAGGMDGDGKVTAVLSGLGLALVLIGLNKRRNFWLGPMVLSLLVVFVAGYNVNDAIEADSEIGLGFASFDVAYGLWIVLVAAAVGTVSAFFSRRKTT